MDTSWTMIGLLMKRIIALTFVLFCVIPYCHAQENVADVLTATVGVGDSRGTLSLSYLHNWRVGKNKKFEIGVGGRFTTFFGSDVYYVTAPAKLTSGSTGPGVIFKENIDANIDSFLIESPRVNAINLMINLGYRFNDKWSAGFNIDVIGFSFGGQKSGLYIDGPTPPNALLALQPADPTSFNALLISDNDRGTLNSEFYAQYAISTRWHLRASAQFLFTEYTTATEVQQLPEPNDRFRDKALMFSVGCTYQLR